MAKAAAAAGPLYWHDGDTEVQAEPEALGDVVLARKDAPVSYHLAVTVDDSAQGVTDIVRGRDLYAATDIHRLLQALLGLATPHYHHHPLLCSILTAGASPSGRRRACARCAKRASIRKRWRRTFSPDKCRMDIPPGTPR